jgi:hypothetical protein
VDVWHRFELVGNHCGSPGVSRNSWGDTSTTLPSRQIEIGRPSRICDSMTFSKAALMAISARSPRGNSRIFAVGLVVFPILRNQSFVCVWLHYTESASIFHCNSSRRMAHLYLVHETSVRARLQSCRNNANKMHSSLPMARAQRSGARKEPRRWRTPASPPPLAKNG